jgi:hypothetical protein
VNWKLGPCLYWLFWAIAFGVWETYAGVEKMGAKDIPMLTQVIVRWVPWWVTMPGITWIFLHFGVRYLHRAAYLKGLLGGKP